MTRKQFVGREFLILALCAGAVAVVASFAASQAAAQQVILFEDFEADTPDTRPATSDFYAKSSVPPGSDPLATVVVTGGAFADPFGIPGNQSMILYNPDGKTQQGISWTNEFSDDPSQFRNGIIEFDMYMEAAVAGDFWSYLDMRIGHGGVDRSLPTATAELDVTAWNSFRVQVDPSPNNIYSDGDQAYYGNFRTFSDPMANVIKEDQAMHIRYDFNGTNTTWQLKIDSTTITWIQDMSQNRPWLLGPDFVNPAPGINVIAFFTAFTPSVLGTVGNVYIDNLKVTNNDLPPPGIPGDLNGDGYVDLVDVQVVGLNWMNTGPPGPPNIPGDANGDGVVNLVDVQVVGLHWHEGTPPGGTAVPEPASFALGAMGLLGLLCFRRPRR